MDEAAAAAAAASHDRQRGPFPLALGPLSLFPGRAAPMQHVGDKSPPQHAAKATKTDFDVK